MKLLEQDKIFINKYFPSLKIEIEGSNIYLRGKLEFHVFYNKDINKYIYYSYDSELDNDKYNIKDYYNIEILISSDNPYRNVKITDNRIKNIAELNNKNIKDLHLYKDSKLCIAGYLDEELEISISKFLTKVVVPFFYDQSFYEKYIEWPRGDYSHGCLGVLENFYNIYENKGVINKEDTINCIKVLLEVYNNDKNSCDLMKKFLLNYTNKPHWLCIYKNNIYINKCKCCWRSYVGLDFKTYKLLSFLSSYISNFSININKIIK